MECIQNSTPRARGPGAGGKRLDIFIRKHDLAVELLNFAPGCVGWDRRTFVVCGDQVRTVGQLNGKSGHKEILARQHLPSEGTAVFGVIYLWGPEEGLARMP